MADKFVRVSRKLTAAQKQQYDEIRRQAKEDFPPLEPPRVRLRRVALRWPSARLARRKGSRSSNSPSDPAWAMRTRFATSNMDRTRGYRTSPRWPTRWACGWNWSQKYPSRDVLSGRSGPAGNSESTTAAPAPSQLVKPGKHAVREPEANQSRGQPMATYLLSPNRILA